MDDLRIPCRLKLTRAWCDGAAMMQGVPQPYIDPMQAPGAQAYPVMGQAIPAGMAPQGYAMTAAPQPPTMDRLLMGDSVMIKQLNSECCRFFCCQPNIHFTLHPYDHSASASFDTVPPVRLFFPASPCSPRSPTSLSPGTSLRRELLARSRNSICCLSRGGEVRHAGPTRPTGGGWTIYTYHPSEGAVDGEALETCEGDALGTCDSIMLGASECRRLCCTST